jgi:hypothetical protein
VKLRQLLRVPTQLYWLYKLQVKSSQFAEGGEVVWRYSSMAGALQISDISVTRDGSQIAIVGADEAPIRIVELPAGRTTDGFKLPFLQPKCLFLQSTAIGGRTLAIGGLLKNREGLSPVSTFSVLNPEELDRVQRITGSKPLGSISDSIWELGPIRERIDVRSISGSQSGKLVTIAGGFRASQDARAKRGAVRSRTVGKQKLPVSSSVRRLNHRSRLSCAAATPCKNTGIRQ